MQIVGLIFIYPDLLHGITMKKKMLAQHLTGRMLLHHIQGMSLILCMTCLVAMHSQINFQHPLDVGCTGHHVTWMWIGEIIAGVTTTKIVRIAPTCALFWSHNWKLKIYLWRSQVMWHDTVDHFTVPVHQDHSVERFNPYLLLMWRIW